MRDVYWFIPTVHDDMSRVGLHEVRKKMKPPSTAWKALIRCPSAAQQLHAVQVATLGPLHVKGERQALLPAGRQLHVPAHLPRELLLGEVHLAAWQGARARGRRERHLHLLRVHGGQHRMHADLDRRALGVLDLENLGDGLPAAVAMVGPWEDGLLALLGIHLWRAHHLDAHRGIHAHRDLHLLLRRGERHPGAAPQVPVDKGSDASRQQSVLRRVPRLRVTAAAAAAHQQ
mmetsp:Transcript_44633/g.114089  ORF Transcript_44633/g.114089 Transcript_44633/m.114089 type:complete len:231 (-) Transcript_44633:411-1103(-)